MRKSSISLAALGVAAALALVGCSSSGGGGNTSTPPAGNSNNSAPSTTTSSSSSAAGGQAMGACNLSNPPQSTAKAPASGGAALHATGKVGVILPDTTSSPRYTLYDKPLLQKALSAAGLSPDIQNAGGSVSTFESDAQNMIGNGVKVLIMDSLDATSGATVEKEATQAGVKVIDYDRVNLGGTAQYYVSFDNEDVGRLQAQTMVDCFNQDGVTNPRIIMLDGGTDTDNNAVLFAKGAHEVLDPLVKAGKMTIVSEVVDKGWDVTQAAPTFTQAFTAAGGKIDGVLAANDDGANAVIGVLKQNGLAGKVVITGQDSGTEGLDNVLQGLQSMTVFKDVAKYEAGAAAKLAIALIANKTPASAGIALTKFDDPKNPSHNIQALLLPVQVITQGQVEDVVKAGALTAKAICASAAVQAACTKFGVQ